MRSIEIAGKPARERRRTEHFIARRKYEHKSYMVGRGNLEDYFWQKADDADQRLITSGFVKCVKLL